MSIVLLRKGVLLYSLLLVLQGCKTAKLIPKEKRVNFDTTTVTLLNGRYANISADSLPRDQTTFWFHFASFIRNRVNARPGSVIEITVIDAHYLEFRLYNGEKLNDTKILPYKLKKGVVLIKGKNNKLREGIPLLIFRKTRERLVMALDKNSNLVMANRGFNSGGIFIFILPQRLKGIHTFLKK